MGRGFNEEIQPGLGSNTDNRLHAGWDGRLPPLHAAGPHLPPVPLRDFDAEHTSLYEDITLSIMDIDLKDFEQHVRGLIGIVPISWTKCLRTLEEVIHQCEGEGLPDVPPARLQGYLLVLRRLTLPTAWPFLCEVHPRDAHALPALQDLPALVAGVQINDARTSIPCL